MVFLITNTKSVGGVANALPLASVTDGKLDVLILKRVSPLTTPDALIKLLQGEHYKHQDIEYFQTKNVKVELIEGPDVGIDYDGELLEETMPIDVSIIEKALKIIVPAK